MKKNILPILALALSMTACVSDEDLDVADNSGYIQVNLSADDAMQTRAVQNVTDLSTWTILVNDGTNDIKWSSTTAFAAGDYTLKASSHANMTAALNDGTDGWGVPYYEGTSATVTVKKGETTNASISCGKAKNARLGVSITDMPTAFSDIKVTATTTESERTTKSFEFTKDTSAGTYAYFKADEVVSYTISYTYNGAPKNITDKTIAMSGAATTNMITVSANDNGTITVTISYDDTFDEGTKEEITIDAATGEIV